MIISIFTFIALLTYPIQILPSKKVVNRCDFMYFDERKRSFILVIFLVDFYSSNNIRLSKDIDIS